MKLKLMGFLCAAVAMVFCLFGCSQSGNSSEPVTETDIMKIDGIYVDDSYVDEENDQLKRVYLFYTLTAADENMEADSKYTELIVDGKNTYESEFYPGACDYMPSYYYSSYIEDVYVDSELKVAAVFEVPEGDLEENKEITLSDTSIPDIDKIRLSTNDIVHCETPEELAQIVDPEGYEEEQTLRESADDSTTKKVKNAINGYYWTFFVNNTSYRTEFYAPNKFTTTTNGLEATGKYTVSNGYIMLTNDSNGYVIEVPYSWEGDEINLDLPAGYSVNE